MSIEVSNLDHLGLVAGMIDEIGIEQKINQLLGEQLPEKITGGQVVKGMVLNGLGKVSSPLYLFSRFFEGKAIEHLIAQGVKAEYFNDDRLLLSIRPASEYETKSNLRISEKGRVLPLTSYLIAQGLFN